MENKTNKINFTKRKILSLIGLIIFSLAFIFALLKNVLPIGKWIVSTFGIVTYPLFLVLGLVELAKFLGLRYRRNVKSTVFALILLTSLLYCIQAISTYSELDKVASFASLKSYIKISYSSKITLVGGFGSIFVGLFSMLLGAMGTIVAFVIFFTISIGLLVDYENYGKFDDNVKKLKTKALREKVNNSDKGAKDGKPAYGFAESGEVVDTIEATESELRYSDPQISQVPTYSDDDVAGEIEDTNNYYNQDDYTNNPFKYQDEDSLTKSRREFMGGTFGGFQEPIKKEEIQENAQEWQTTYEPETPAYNEPTYNEPTQVINIPKSTKDLWGNEEPQDKIDIDDNVKSILTKEEDEVDISSPDDTTNLFGDDEFNKNQTNTPFKNDFENQKPSNVNFGGDGFDMPKSPFKEPVFKPNNENDILKRNEGILTGTPTTPTTETKVKPVIPSGNPIAMPGVRYNPPPLSLLSRPVKDNGDYSEEQARKSKQLEDVLESFNVPAKVVNIVRGPKITRYELSVPYGVSVKKIPNYEQDIQRALAAKSVTIQAPIPGSSYVGIELENDVFTNVCERELLESPEFQNAKGALPIAIGKDISGQIIVKNLTKMVHCLVAGSTGSGKSVFIHNIVLSLVYKYSPNDLRLVMVDPKQVEFKFYNGLPHLITPEVVLGTEKAVSALKWCVKEMDRRFKLMGQANYQNIEEYNKSELVKSGQFEHFPYIVIIVDELAEIMLNYKKEAEPLIQRITQLARACGMHLIVAVQRPSVDVITGVIKNNISSRFAFRLQSYVDSKTMLGTNGAEKLLNRGDMLMQLTDTSAMPRLQGAYASNDEIKAVVDFIKSNNPAQFDEEIEKAFNSDPLASDESAGEVSFAAEPQSKGKMDDYFMIAVKAVMMAGSASVSYLQRRLSIGYSRAARIIDQMEEKGFIDPPTGAKQRKVLITPEKFKEIFGEDFNS